MGNFFENAFSNSVFSNKDAMQLAGLAVMGGEMNVGKAISDGLTQSALMKQQQQQQAEYERQEKMRQMMPQIMKGLDKDPDTAVSQLASIGMPPEQAMKYVMEREQQQRMQQDSALRQEMMNYRYQRLGSGGGATGATYEDADGNILEPTPPPKKPGKNLSDRAINTIAEKVATRDAFNTLSEGFKDDFGGFKSDTYGNISNWAGRTFGDDSGQSQWWQGYQEQKNIVRNKLFGSALTKTEKDEFEKANITPGMDVKQIRINLKRQTDAINLAAEKLGNVYRKGNYNTDQLDELMGTDPAMETPVATTSDNPPKVTNVTTLDPNAEYPRKVVNSAGKQATVSNAAEAEEAAKEGYK